MALEIRPYTQDEQVAASRVASIVFGNYSSAPPDLERLAAFKPEWSLCAFEDGQIATTYGAYPFVLRLNGGKTPAAGITFVGTLPWFRRRGHLRQIMEADFKRRYEQRMEPVAILLASIAAIYQRYGYAVVSSKYRYSIDPRWINIAPSVPKATGAFREATLDERPLLDRIYRDYAKPRNGYVHRAPVAWDNHLGIAPNPGGPDMGPSLIAIYEEGGEPKGYVLYAARHFETHQDGGPPGQRIHVRDYAWLTPGAYRAMWDHFKTFDLAARVGIFCAPTDDPAFDIMLDPRELNATRGDWLLGRIIDLERVLAARPYGAEGKVVFEVQDAMCPWNAGRWSLEAGPEGAHVTRTKETAQLSLDISGLAQLMFGFVSPTQATRVGRAEATADAPLRLWDEMWRTEYAPFCPDGF